MTEPIKEKAIKGTLWNATGNLSVYGFEFVIGIILARLLTPEEFGLIGAIMVFIGLSQIFVRGGFSQALIRKKECTVQDYSTAFIFNLITAIVFFLILYVTAKPISIFLNNPDLEPLVQVLGIGLIIGSLSLVQSADLSRQINFKAKSKILIFSSLISGVSAVVMAFYGFGVWSLVGKNLLKHFTSTILYWCYGKWHLVLCFSNKSFKELFGFGYKLLLSGLIDTLFKNANYLIIAKFLSAPDLGFFTRAEMFRNLASNNVSSVITAVGYPVMAKFQDEAEQLKNIFRRIFTLLFFVISILMVGIAASAEAMILSLVGDQWVKSIFMLQLLSIAGVFIPLNSLSANLLNVVGRSDIYLRLQLVSQLLTIPNIFLTIFWGIDALIVGIIIKAALMYVVFYSKAVKVHNYSFKEQIKDIKPTLLLLTVLFCSVFSISYLGINNYYIVFGLQVIVGVSVVVVASELIKLNEYMLLKNIVKDKLGIGA
ncbi:lipopolysaccharide biosynthesis protein [Labilibacter sediminis]|nr:lipopolysaccharide biosynthesis protein [Labilibacter sediminis]